MGGTFSDRKCKMNTKKMCGFTSLVKIRSFTRQWIE